MASRLRTVRPGGDTIVEIREHATAGADQQILPTVWIEAESSSATSSEDPNWLQTLTRLNQGRDGIQEQGACHVVLAGPRTLHQTLMQRAPDLSSIVSPALLLDETLESLVTDAPVLTWMHLSDLHVQSEDWQQDHVLSALVRDLPELLESRSLAPDLLFVTGDVASRGRAGEYDGAFRVLNDVATVLGIDRRLHVFMVPGNHDVDRTNVSGMVVGHHAWLLEQPYDALRSQVGTLMGDADEFARYGRRLGPWCAFTEQFLGRARSVSPERPWRSDVVDVRGLQVGVLSLCSVWAGGANDDNGRLVLGERQVLDMVRETQDGGAQLTFALMHHPLSWLHPQERGAIRSHLERDVDVVLHGHVHDAHDAVQRSGGATHATLGAGAAYAGAGTRQDPYHGVSVARLDTDKGELEVHHFTWSTRRQGWHADAGIPGADERGVVCQVFVPDKLAVTAKADPGSAQQVLATRLRHAAARVYASADVAGIGAGTTRGHIALDKIYVPQRIRGGDDLHDLEWLESILFSPPGLASRLVVLGDPGSGKSTLCKHLAAAAAHREGGPVALLLTVRDWIAEGGREGLLEMAARQAGQELSVRTTPDALEQLCVRGEVLLLVDGIDEAANPAARRALRDRLHGFAADKPSVPIVATSRVAGYGEVPLTKDVFWRYTLEPFDDDALELFVHRWYAVAESNPVDRQRKRLDLLRALEAEPRAKELARNPLLATLIAMVHFSHAQLPGDRAELYALIVRLLLITWPADRGREMQDLHGSVQQPMLERLALQLQEQRAAEQALAAQAGGPAIQADPQVVLRDPHFREYLGRQLSEQFPERTPHEVRDLAQRWSVWLVNDSGLFQEHQPGKFGFLHLSLLEYMAGQALLHAHIKQGHDAIAAMVAERHTDALWIETLLLMLGSENNNRALGEAVVERLLEAEGQTWATAVFLLRVLREEVDIGPILRDRVVDRARQGALDVEPAAWLRATRPLGDVVQFGKKHGPPVDAWLRNQLERALADDLRGTVALTPTGALGPEQLVALIAARPDVANTQSALLDMGPTTAVGRWARSTSRDVVLEWALQTPIEGRSIRSLEGIEGFTPAAAWIPSLLGRACWLAQSVEVSAQLAADHDNRIPSTSAWSATNIRKISIHHACSFETQSTGDSGEAVARFAQRSTRHSIQLSTIFSPQHVTEHTTHHITARSMLNLSLNFAEHFTEHFASYFGPNSKIHLFAPDATREFARDFTQEFTGGITGNLGLGLTGTFVEDFVPTIEINHASDLEAIQLTPSILVDRLRKESILQFGQAPFFGYVLGAIGEAHASLITSRAFVSATIPSAIAVVRIQNRWINVFFDHLVDYAGHMRPIADTPDLHALLLTYGLIQYQTTWEWPDSHHWHTWFSGPAPEHWLPAHVWHLVRALENPTDPTHLDRADACLDRNDWPALAAALRDNAIKPTSAETLALFGDGTPEQ